MKKLHGITIAMVTPMDEEEQVNYAALRQLTDFLIDREVDCLYPCGTTGEMFHLAENERRQIAETVVEQANGRATVFIHVGAMDKAETIRLAQHARSIGADGVGIVTPAFFPANSAELEEYFITIARALPDDFPIYLYNIPQLAVNDLTVSLVKHIADACPNVIGIKYSFSDMFRAQEYLQIRENFSVLLGADRLLIAMLAMGCDGTVTGAGCVYPEPFVAILKAYREGNLPYARKLQWVTNKLVEITRCGSNMAYFKAALDRRGIECGKMRAPQLPLSNAEKAEYFRELEEVEALLPEGMLKKL